MLGTMKIESSQSVTIARNFLKVSSKSALKNLVDEESEGDCDEAGDYELQVVHPVISQLHVLV